VRRWRYLIILGSGVSALAIGLSAQAQTEQGDLLALLSNAWSAIS
jgi:hypothetical protein